MLFVQRTFSNKNPKSLDHGQLYVREHVHGMHCECTVEIILKTTKRQIVVQLECIIYVYAPVTWLEHSISHANSSDSIKKWDYVIWRYSNMAIIEVRAKYYYKTRIKFCTFMEIRKKKTYRAIYLGWKKKKYPV